MTEIRLCAHRRPWSSRIDNVREYGSGVSRPEAFHPRDHELRFAQREAVVIDELTVTRNCRPWRHVASDDVGANLPALKPGLLIGFERKRRAIFNMAHD